MEGEQRPDVNELVCKFEINTRLQINREHSSREGDLNSIKSNNIKENKKFTATMASIRLEFKPINDMSKFFQFSGVISDEDSVETIFHIYKIL